MTVHNNIADALNFYFTSIASSLLANSNEVESEFVPDAAPSNIESLKFTLRNVNEVSKAIKDLNQTKATGSDGISAKVLKMAEPTVSQSLTHIFNESLQAGQFPSARPRMHLKPPGTLTHSMEIQF